MHVLVINRKMMFYQQSFMYYVITFDILRQHKNVGHYIVVV